MHRSLQSAPATGADGGTDFAVGIARLARLPVPAPCGFCNWEASRRRGERGLRQNPSIRARTRNDGKMNRNARSPPLHAQTRADRYSAVYVEHISEESI